MTGKPLHKTAQIHSISEAAEDTCRISFKAPRISSQSSPGQFLHLEVPGKPLRRPVSIFSKSRETVEIVFRIKGPGTLYLSRLKKGETVDLIGPVGNGFIMPEKHPLFVGGGLGAAPLNFLALNSDKPGTFLFGARTESDFFELSGLKGGFHEMVAVCEEETGNTVVEVMKNHMKPGISVYAAGPRGMLEKVERICKEEGLTGYISWEEFMGCGIGICQACAVNTNRGYKRTCSDGPVFRMGELNWNDIDH